MVAQTRGGSLASPQKLKFHDKLIGKSLSTDTLLKKLKTLHTQLAELDQDRVDTATLATVRKELIHNTILLHKDRGVKAYAACCLADILRLFAPDAPYMHNELRDIFQFFFRQLATGLRGSDSPYYNEYFHLLESLSTVKSIVLVCDLPNADELMVDIFRDFFVLVRHDLSKKIELHMVDVLVALIDEATSLPSELMDIIMAQFLDKNVGLDNPAFRLAVQVCNTTSDRLQRHVCQYFTEIIVQHAPDDELDDIRKAHELVKQLNKFCSPLLHLVIPQLEEELRVEDLTLRTMATQVLGDMFADKGGADLLRKYPTTWSFWNLRRNDKSPVVRLAFVEAAYGLLVGLPEQRDFVEEILGAKLFDPDEKVRAAVCKLYSQLDYETALHHVSEAQLRRVAERGLDKKHAVRIEALNSIGRLYSLAYPEIENGDQGAIKQFSWIAQSLLQMTQSQEVKVTAEHALAEYIFPLITSYSRENEIKESTWTDRLLTTMKFLNERTINSLISFSGLKIIRPSIYERFVQCCKENNGGIIDENEEETIRKLNICIQRLSATFPDSQKAADDLSAFAKLNEGRLYKLLETCMDTQTSLKALVKSFREFLRRLEQSSVGILPTMMILLRRASLCLVNQSSVPYLLRHLERGGPTGDGYGTSHAQALANNAQILLTSISKHCPIIYKAHAGALTKAIADDKNGQLVRVCLQALSALARCDDELVSRDKRTTERIVRFALDSDHRHAKYSARLLATSKNKEDFCVDIINTISEDLKNVDDQKLVAHITVLAEFAQNAPDAFESKSEEVMNFIVKQILMSPSPWPRDPDEMDVDAEWVEKSEVPPSLSKKIVALKVCRNRCLAHAMSDTALNVATPVLRMFFALLEHGGSLHAENQDDPKVKVRMRLQAAVSLLHLSTVPKFATVISNNLVSLAIMIQDPCYQVRDEFLRKFISLATHQQLPPHFNVVPFLTVHDPETDIKDMAKAFVSLAYRAAPPSVKMNHFEMIFVQFLHLLAHHPDFALTQESVPDMAKYIDFFLGSVASAENVSLLYHLSGKAKTVRDSESHLYSENLYALSELAQHIIKDLAKRHSWTLQSFPTKVKLPTGILRPLPNAEAANKILRQVFLPSEALDWLDRARLAKFSTTETNAPDRPKAKHRSTEKRKKAGRSKNHAKRLRGSGRNQREENSSERSDEEHSDPDNSEKGIEDNTSDSICSKSSPNSEDDPSESRRPGRDARTRAKAKIKRQVQKKIGKKV
ncbi:armadillo-type protein [Russula earlei]|uniref:Armadillo-type protein n=1 Tax=Russula earlei TaxID=71964 RepID=A0ACC0UK42_9AGAM|nr:armadillo-type protein [Russula earlei]